jgi:hypothetical protein
MSAAGSTNIFSKKDAAHQAPVFIKRLPSPQAAAVFE